MTTHRAILPSMPSDAAEDAWVLAYEGFDPNQEGLREALCTLGNGYFATRGAGAEVTADEVHYPGTYVAGCYNRLTTRIGEHAVENESLVNVPNWLPLTFRIADGPWFHPAQVELLAWHQELDLSQGVLHRLVRFRDREGRETAVRCRRLVHMRYPHLCALELRVVPENWSGMVTFRTALDGRVTNQGVERYRRLDGRHLEPVRGTVGDGETMQLRVRTVQSRIEIAQVARTRARGSREQAPAERRPIEEDGYVAQEFTLDAETGVPLTVDKLVALYTSGDRAISEPGLAARIAIERADGFDALLASHARAWRHLWHRFDISMEGRQVSENRRDASLVLRLHVCHLLQTVSLNSMDLDVGVPARGLHGEAYRGHIFWDELFVFPFLNLRMPAITRSLLRYRYRRLEEARAEAREAGFRGAMYPWQSGSDGREESQRLHLNPRSGRWVPDNSWLQRHVNSAIAYNVWQYYQATNDMQFMRFYGAEMLLEIARFWTSIATWNEELERYEILGVMGPDEYHERYPDRDEPGLDNNAYTNVMAAWVLWRALDLLDCMPEDQQSRLREHLSLDDEELALWDAVSRRLRIPFHGEGIISQFEGYERLEPFDWEGYREKYDDIQRLDRILEAEHDTPDRYQVSKQADVLMLFYLFSTEELGALFERLGYEFDPDLIPRNIDYYLDRTSHGSTLSAQVHSWVLARSDRERSWHLFRRALESDVADVQGGTTPEGIHLGAMAGTVDQVQRCYTGIEVREDVLWLNPQLPEEVSCLRLGLWYRNHSIALEMTPTRVRIRSLPSVAESASIGFEGAIHELRAGESLELDVTDADGQGDGATP